MFLKNTTIPSALGAGRNPPARGFVTQEQFIIIPVPWF